jgi:hypothetical protein
MNLRTYTLSVSLAAIIGLLLSVVPLVRNALEYRSPSPGFTEPRELSSLEAYVVANEKNEWIIRKMNADHNGWNQVWGQQWKAMYDAAKTQHTDATRQQVESIRRKAVSNLAAYGTLCGLCLVLLVMHLLWARRVLSTPSTNHLQGAYENSK